jgi:hypothetical protein
MFRSLLGHVVAVAALGVSSAAAQVPERFENLKILPADTSRAELVAVMREFAGALGVRCNHCHVGPENLLEMDFATDEKPEKVLARDMMRMVERINADLMAKMDFPAPRQMKVQCVTCHHGVALPLRIEQVLSDTLAEQGADAAIKRYLELKGKYFGRASYDFGAPPLTSVAEQLARSENTDAALTMAEFASVQFPDQAWPQFVFANVLAAAGHKDRAAAAYERVLELEPEHEQARNRLERLRSEANIPLP